MRSGGAASAPPNGICGASATGSSRRNFRAAGAEIDLVAIDGETLVFVEVKTRSSRAAGGPEEAVDERKQKQMRRAAEAFARRYRADEIEMRFDIIAVDASGKRLEIELLRNAF